MSDEDIILKETPRRRFLLIGVFIFTLILVIVLFSDYGVVNRIKLNYEVNNLKTEIQNEQHKQDSLKKEIKRLQSDYLTVEAVARLKYGMIKKNEEVVLILDSIAGKANVSGN
ncbi:MAG TPA: septum formation initiator family protein [Candidatus Kapabacteria bacterium]|nr:septum formation initiator family protein [Candidatus Kapabacteria bacterium]